MKNSNHEMKVEEGRDQAHGKEAALLPEAAEEKRTRLITTIIYLYFIKEHRQVEKQTKWPPPPKEQKFVKNVNNFDCCACVLVVELLRSLRPPEGQVKKKDPQSRLNVLL